MQQGCGENLYNQNVRQTFHHIVIESFSQLIVLPAKRQFTKGDWVVEESNVTTCLHRWCEWNNKSVYLLFSSSFSEILVFPSTRKRFWKYTLFGENSSSFPLFTDYELSQSTSCAWREGKLRGRHVSRASDWAKETSGSIRGSRFIKEIVICNTPPPSPSPPAQ